jgi:UDP-N-acetylmuramate--alanine ligase
MATTRRYHFSGIAGAGMAPLARLVRAQGHAVQGSDRSFDQGKSAEVAGQLRALGIELFPQDGSAITRGVDRLVHSTAVEAGTPEMRAARDLGIETVPRPALLAEVVNGGAPGVAIAGTSGKSTIVGMLAWLLRESGRGATVLGGAALVGEGSGGCFVDGTVPGPVVAEACESDGTLVGYRPAIGLIHNVSRDHAEVDALRPQFTSLARHAGQLFVNARCAVAAGLGRDHRGTTYGLAPDADVRLEIAAADGRAAGVLRAGSAEIALEVPQPGRHNLENAAAAAVVALQLGVPPRAVETLLAKFPGVARRFEVVGVTPSGIRVVDDYAHNGEKLRAAVTAAQAGAGRVLAVFQPHGYGPARFLRPELATLFPRLLRPGDRLCYAEIFYAGGTVARDISSRALAADLAGAVPCAYAPDHASVCQWVRGEARPGDTVLIMGARDPDLPRLARAVFASLPAA